MINAQVILDSVNPDGNRLTTLLLEYPRFIHAEFMTHRMFSRNAASSRAVPTAKMIERILENPAQPQQWGFNNAGMQSHSQMDAATEEQTRMLWYKARDEVLKVVEEMQELNPHKQIINRLLEPWLHIQVVLSATEFDNFFTLRDHPDAQPEIQILAREMKRVMNDSSPILLDWGDWHIPFLTDNEKSLNLQDKLKVSTARCARVSYYLHDKKEVDYEKDIQLHDRLVGSVPRHSSPTEHQAKAVPGRYANFIGWLQYRALLE